MKKYHRDFYRPENLYLIVTGAVEPSEVLSRLQSFEDKIEAKVRLFNYSALRSLEKSSLNSLSSATSEIMWSVLTEPIH